ncbi:family 10 glycosylhydrolase [Flammeovirga sp. MY04]|uniref:glycoside hydrolase family 10 protein n=1 Tax=Flammeovirga sp. MY04 TaxID=1191459 RepID=UPI0008064456|nr:family 10 glycosylhydrolase [Flammeovirga sp. MY04]ANQ50940.1 family 10 glycosylhydrolase [Flammeovirga sp. MY04]
MKSGYFFTFIFSLIFSFSSFAQKRELRAVWIATVNNIDFPTNNSMSPNDLKADYVRYLDKIKSTGLNTVIVQVRPVADTFYPSGFEPWSKYMTGKQGVAPNPYFNPLQFMIEEAHQRDLDFHAWFNPYRATMNSDTTALSQEHPFYQHRDWFVKYGNKYMYNPGHPDAREYVLDAIMEVVRHYDLDAVHFDDYFYPYKVQGEVFPDSTTFAENNPKQFDKIEDWRRDNVDYFVENLSSRIKQERPDVQFGISPFGVWRNSDIDPKGSKTRAGITNYDDLYADVVKWMKKGWLDYVIPQVYWHRKLGAAPYEEVVKWWDKNSYGTQLYIGHALYKVEKWEANDEIAAQLDINKKYKNVQGSAFFSAKFLFSNPKKIVQTLQRNYPYFTLPPSGNKMDQTPPSKVRISSTEGQLDAGLKITWEDIDFDTNAKKYLIYRYEDFGFGVLDGQFIHKIINRSPYKEQVFIDDQLEKGKQYTYIITALSNNKIESNRSNAITVKAGGFLSKKIKVLH